MNEVIIRKGSILNGKHFDSINKAKKASRKLQVEGFKVRVIPVKQPQYYPINNNLRKPHHILYITRAFWKKMEELRIGANLLNHDWHFARKICHLWARGML